MNMLAIRNQIAAALAPPASSGANVGPRVRHQLAAHRGGADGAEPHQRQHDEEQPGHPAAGEDGTRDVARRILGLADVARRGLEGGRGEADEVQAGHRGGDGSEEPVEGRVQMEGHGLLVVDRPGEDRHDRGQEREPRRDARDRDGDARDRAHAEEVDRREREHDRDRERGDRDPRQVPLVQRGGREDRREAAGRDPAPPVADPRQIREDRAVGPERLGARGRDAADPLGPHEHELDPSGRGGPAEQQADDQDRDRAAALGGDQRPHEEHHLVRAAHGESRRSEPADRARVLTRLRAIVRDHLRLHTDGVRPRTSKPEVHEAGARHSAIAETC